MNAYAPRGGQEAWRFVHKVADPVTGNTVLISETIGADGRHKLYSIVIGWQRPGTGPSTPDASRFVRVRVHVGRDGDVSSDSIRRLNQLLLDAEAWIVQRVRADREDAAAGRPVVELPTIETAVPVQAPRKEPEILVKVTRSKLPRRA